MPYDLETRCGGTGMLNCFCAGDFCACSLNGEGICFGCEDCEGMDDAPTGELKP